MQRKLVKFMMHLKLLMFSYFYKQLVLLLLMDKKLGKKIEGKVGKKLGGAIEREVEREVERGVKKEVKQIEVEVKKRVEREIEKRLHHRIYNSTVSSALKFRDEFKNQIVVGVTAAFAFLIALSWREPIAGSVDAVIVSLGLSGREIYLQYLSAIFITIIAVLVLMGVSRWKSK